MRPPLQERKIMKKLYKGFLPMHNRSSTPDILGSIMTGSLPKEEIKKIIPAIQEDLKEKATFNLSVAVLHELEDVCHEIRKLCRSKQISKTLIVEEALKMAFEEFSNKEKKSSLFDRLEKHLKKYAP
jgi:hypothetical protein